MTAQLGMVPGAPFPPLDVAVTRLTPSDAAATRRLSRPPIVAHQSHFWLSLVALVILPVRGGS